MNWYRVVIIHGPGHQTQTIWYRYSTKARINDEIETDYFQWPIVTMKKIYKLPIAVKKQLINEQLSTLRHTKYMLRLIRNS